MRDRRSCCGSSACAPASPALFAISMVVNVGMWLERYIIIVVSLSPRLPAVVVGHVHRRRVWDWSTFIGTIGLFLTLAVPVHPLPADDLDLRDAHAAAGGRGEGGAGMTRRPPIYGLMAEFNDPERAGERGARRARGGLSPARRLHAVPDRGALRGAGHAPQPPAAARADRRHRRRPAADSACSTGPR